MHLMRRTQFFRPPRGSRSQHLTAAERPARSVDAELPVSSRGLASKAAVQREKTAENDPDSAG